MGYASCDGSATPNVEHSTEPTADDDASRYTVALAGRDRPRGNPDRLWRRGRRCPDRRDTALGLAGLPDQRFDNHGAAFREVSCRVFHCLADDLRAHQHMDAERRPRAALELGLAGLSR